MLRHAVAAVLAGMTAAPALAADENNHFAVRGAGIASCTQFLESREARSEQYFQFGGWMNGFLSAVNRYEDDTYDVVPWQSADSLASALANYCSQNPDQSFHGAMVLMIQTLRPDRLTHRSDMLTIEVDGSERPIRLYQASLEQVMARLGQAGYEVGTADSEFDDQDRQALADFQLAEGLPVTGLPDQATLLRLFYPPSSDSTDINEDQ